jgi:hypothetical protein
VCSSSSTLHFSIFPFSEMCCIYIMKIWAQVVEHFPGPAYKSQYQQKLNKIKCEVNSFLGWNTSHFAPQKTKPCNAMPWLDLAPSMMTFDLTFSHDVLVSSTPSARDPYYSLHIHTLTSLLTSILYVYSHFTPLSMLLASSLPWILWSNTFFIKRNPLWLL